MHDESAISPVARSRGRRAWQFLRTNRGFFSFLVASHLVLLIVALWPIVNENLGVRTASDNAPSPRRSRAKLFHETNVFRISLVWGVCGVACYVLCFRERRLRTLRTIAFAGAALSCVGLIVANQRLLNDHVLSDEKAWTNIEQLRIVDCENAEVNSFQIRQEMRKNGVASFGEFHRRVMQEYVEAQPRLKQSWSAVAGDDAKLKTLFIMNFVSGLWSFGNREAVSRTGCVFSNEENDWQIPAESLRPYLESQIGCCTDFAFMTKFLLDREGIENRLTAIPGHVFNEVKLGDHWCIVDPTVNLFVDCGWEDLYEGKRDRDSVTVLLFPHPSLADASSAHYRSLAGHFRVVTLTRLANRPPHLRHTEHPALPGHFSP